MRDDTFDTYFWTTTVLVGLECVTERLVLVEAIVQDCHITQCSIDALTQVRREGMYRIAHEHNAIRSSCRAEAGTVLTRRKSGAF